MAWLRVSGCEESLDTRPLTLLHWTQTWHSSAICRKLFTPWTSFLFTVETHLRPETNRWGHSWFYSSGRKVSGNYELCVTAKKKKLKWDSLLFKFFSSKVLKVLHLLWYLTLLVFFESQVDFGRKMTRFMLCESMLQNIIARNVGSQVVVSSTVWRVHQGTAWKEEIVEIHEDLPYRWIMTLLKYRLGIYRAWNEKHISSSSI